MQCYKCNKECVSGLIVHPECLRRKDEHFGVRKVVINILESALSVMREHNSDCQHEQECFDNEEFDNLAEIIDIMENGE